MHGLLLVVLLAQSPQPPISRTPEPRGTAESPVVVQIQPAPQTDAEAAAQRWTQGLGLTTVLLALLQLGAIAFQVYIAGRQNRIVEEQSRIMEEQRNAAAQQSEYMRDGLEETRKAAEAANVSAEALKIIHRQWIVVDKWRCDVLKLGVDQLEAVVSVTIRNSTPLPLTLRSVRCYFGLSKGDHGRRDRIIEPGGSATEEISHLLTEKETETYRSGKQLQLGVIGWVDFVDAFGQLQAQPVGVQLQVDSQGGFSTRELTDIKRNLDRKSKENPWAIDE